MDGAGADWRRMGVGMGFPRGDSGRCPRLRIGYHLLPFFKVYEKQLLAQEAEEAQRAAQENEQTA